jgi:hypothetical protein
MMNDIEPLEKDNWLIIVQFEIDAWGPVAFSTSSLQSVAKYIERES